MRVLGNGATGELSLRASEVRRPLHERRIPSVDDVYLPRGISEGGQAIEL